MPSEQRLSRVRRLVVCAVGVCTLAGCSGSSDANTAPVEPPPAEVEAVPGAGVSRISLSESAADRLGIETQPVVATRSTGRATSAMPYSALIYDAEGRTWAYTSPEPLTYQRAPVRVVGIVGGEVRMSRGPGRGTEVVTVGAAELFGEEQDVGH